MIQADTIAAIATPPGTGGIGIVRASGPGAERIGQALFRPRAASGPFRSHRLTHGEIVCPATGRVLGTIGRAAIVARYGRSLEGIASTQH